MALLYLLRHGQSQANLHPELIGGRTSETPLSELGANQAKRAGAYMARMLIRPSLVAVSPAVRTMDTAAYALHQMNYRGRVVIDPAFQELSQGVFEGQPRIETYTPERLEQIAQRGKNFKLPGGESVAEVGERMKAAVCRMDNLVRCTPREDAAYEAARGIMLPECGLIVTHETAIKSLVARIKGYDQEWVYRTRLPNASLTRLTVNGDAIILDMLGSSTQS